MSIRKNFTNFKKAYTLIEIIMVVVIIATLAVVTIPRFKSFYYIKLNGTIKKVVSNIRYVQQVAVAQHTDCRIEFNINPVNSYQACYCNQAAGCVSANCGTANWPFIRDPFTRKDLRVYFNTDPQYKGITIVSASFGGGTVLRFDYMGVPENASGTPLVSDGSVVFSYPGQVTDNLTINVTRNTGQINAQ